MGRSEGKMKEDYDIELIFFAPLIAWLIIVLITLLIVVVLHG